MNKFFCEEVPNERDMAEISERLRNGDGHWIDVSVKIAKEFKDIHKYFSKLHPVHKSITASSSNLVATKISL